jgi:hypothetical protein
LDGRAWSISCERNRERFFKGVASAGSPAAQAFGSREEGAAALEDLFAVGRASTAATVPAPLAEAQTRLLFAQIKQAGIAPPAHSASGLPRPDAQQGYALVQRTLTALARGEALPEPSARLLEARGRQRQLAGRSADLYGQVRCAGCGQFASAIRGHLCLRTAAQLQRSLCRQLGAPPGAYPEAALKALLAEARAGPVTMRHAATSEQVQVSLDGLLPALRVGFAPVSWAAGPRVATSGGGVLVVCAPEAGPPVPTPSDPVARAASATGLVLDDPAAMLGNETVPVQVWLASADIRQLAAGAWTHARQIPPSVSLLLRREAPRLAADPSLPTELRERARALAERTFRPSKAGVLAEQLRSLAQAALAATGGVSCERCGAWYERRTEHACAGVALDPRVAGQQAEREAATLGFNEGGQVLIANAVRLGRIAPADAGPLLRLARAWAVLDDQALTAGKIASAVQLWEQGIGRLDQPATSPEAALLQTLSAEGDLASAVLRANAGERITPDQEQRLLALAGLPDREALRTHALAQEALWQERQRIVQRLHDETAVQRVGGGWEVTLPDGSATKVRTRAEALSAHRQRGRRHWRRTGRGGGRSRPRCGCSRCTGGTRYGWEAWMLGALGLG